MYDLHNKLRLNEKSTKVEGFGIKGLGVVFDNKFDSEKFDDLKKELRGEGSKGLRDLVSVVQIKAKTKGELKTSVQRVRNKVAVVMVHAQNIDVARAAAEMSAVDIISHAFVDQTTAREAAKNNVALEINLRDILGVYGMKRANLISKINFNLQLARKYKVPFVATTGAHSLLDMRASKQIMMFLEAIGFKKDEAKKAVITTPKKIVETNRKKLTDEIIAEGIMVKK